MQKTKIISVIAAGALVLVLGIVPVRAEENTGTSVQNRATIREEVKNQRQELKDERQNAKPTIKSMNLLQRLFAIRAVVTGDISAKTDTTITVIDKDDVSYTVNITDKTVLMRKFWGKATLAEMKVGDTVNVVGKWVNRDTKEINAQLVRDISIQKRAGAFFGNVLTLTANGWTIQTARGKETVTITGTTKLVNRKEEAIKQADIVIGHRIRVKGLWDANANTITEATQVKDFTLPVIVKSTGTPTPKATATPTVTPIP